VPAACSKLQEAREREMLLVRGALERDVHYRQGGPGRGTDLTDREAAVGRKRRSSAGPWRGMYIIGTEGPVEGRISLTGRRQ
jgi:hypothetical protein